MLENENERLFSQKEQSENLNENQANFDDNSEMNRLLFDQLYESKLLEKSKEEEKFENRTKIN